MDFKNRGEFSLKSAEWKGATMQKFVFATLLTVLLPLVVRAQETIGPKAEEAKKEIMQIEHDKPAALLDIKGGGNIAWSQRYDAPVVEDGAGRTKDAHIAHFKDPDAAKLRSMVQVGHIVHIYDDARVAVVTYHDENGFSKDSDKDNIAISKSEATEVWVQVPDGRWLRILHTSVSDKK